MKITIESTDELTTIDGVPVRRWRGMTARGVPCDVFVRLVRVLAWNDQADFERELKEVPAPSMPTKPGAQTIDPRLVL